MTVTVRRLSSSLQVDGFPDGPRYVRPDETRLLAFGYQGADVIVPDECPNSRKVGPAQAYIRHYTLCGPTIRYRCPESIGAGACYTDFGPWGAWRASVGHLTHPEPGWFGYIYVPDMDGYGCYVKPWSCTPEGRALATAIGWLP